MSVAFDNETNVWCGFHDVSKISKADPKYEIFDMERWTFQI